MQKAVASSALSSDTRAPSPGDVLASFRGAPHAHIDIGHTRLAYRRFGRGPDLVFVHGWPLHAGTFRALVPLLADRFTCHLLDLPGAGQTECTRQTPIDLASHAASLRAALEKLELARYALVAHDSGGAIARLLAADNPRVAALVMSGTEIPKNHPLLITFLKAMAAIPGGASLVMLTMRLRAVRRSNLGFAGCFANLDHIDGEFHELFIAPMLRSPRLAASQFALVRNLDVGLVDRLGEVHRRIRAPTLLLWGEHDPIFPLAKVSAMAREFAGGARLEVLPAGKTFVHEEQPEAFSAHARPFLLAALEGEARAAQAS
jgi:haloalkane dehalogenase